MTFSPSHEGTPLPFERLSDGQKSLLYISLVLAWQALARRVLSGEDTSLDPDRLRPPVHTVIALEEPENSLAPDPCADALAPSAPRVDLLPAPQR